VGLQPARDLTSNCYRLGCDALELKQESGALVTASQGGGLKYTVLAGAPVARDLTELPHESGRPPLDGEVADYMVGERRREITGARRKRKPNEALVAEGLRCHEATETDLWPCSHGDH
jgi:hypothetical protein